MTGSPACAGSGSTRSPTSAATKYLTVVVDHDSGRLVWAAPGRDKATLERFFDALGEDRCAQITHVSRRRRGLDQRRGRATAARTRCAAPTRSTSSRGPPRPSTTSAARPGTTPAADQAAAPTGSDGRVDASVKTPPAPRRRSSTPATRCGRTPRTSPTDSAAKLAWIAKTDPRLHRAYLLKEGLRLVFQLGYDEAGEALEPGSAGPAAAASPPSSTCSAASSNTRPRSSPRSSTACPTGSSNRSTPRSGSSPASRSASTHPTPSSPSPCSPSAATDPPSPAGNDPRISQESRLSAAIRCQLSTGKHTGSWRRWWPDVPERAGARENSPYGPFQLDPSIPQPKGSAEGTRVVSNGGLGPAQGGGVALHLRFPSGLGPRADRSSEEGCSGRSEALSA